MGVEVEAETGAEAEAEEEGVGATVWWSCNVDHPMCGTGKSVALLNQVTVPGTMDRPSMPGDSSED